MGCHAYGLGLNQCFSDSLHHSVFVYFIRVENFPSQYRFRRANIDDIPALQALWFRHDFDPEELEQRLIEFQVAESESGELHAAIGIRTAQRQALLHHECWSAEMTPSLRRNLATHAFSVCEKMQVWRVWTNLADIHWEEMGFDAASPEQLDELPPGFGDWKQSWMFRKLKEDIANNENLARQFELLKMENDVNNTRIAQTGKLMQLFGYLVVSVIVVAIILGVIAYIQKS